MRFKICSAFAGSLVAFGPTDKEAVFDAISMHQKFQTIGVIYHSSNKMWVQVDCLGAAYRQPLAEAHTSMPVLMPAMAEADSPQWPKPVDHLAAGRCLLLAYFFEG